MTALEATAQTNEITKLHQQLDGVTSGLGANELRELIAMAARIRAERRKHD